MSDVRLAVVRHGETIWAPSGRFTGSLDVPLSDVGRRQACAAARALAPLKPWRVLSSDLSRAWETAERIAAESGLRALADPALREESLGRWEGRTRLEVARMYPGAFERWRSGEVRPHGGREGLLVVGERILGAVRTALRGGGLEATGHPLIVVTHANAGLALMGRLLSLPPERWISIGSLGPGAWSILSADALGRWSIQLHNTTVREEHVQGAYAAD